MSKSETKVGLGARIGGFFRGVKTEFRKIIWPDRDTLLRQLVAVLSVAVIMGAIITVVDFGYQNLFDFLMGLSF